MSESYNKLVRDRIPEILDRKGVVYEQRVASAEEYRIELIKKLDEEVAEFLEAETPDELADVVEVIEALKMLEDFSTTETLRLQKRKDKGGFEKGIIMKGEK